MKYCAYHDVMAGKYDCNYATVVNNTVVCTSKECEHGGDYMKEHLIGLSDEEQKRRFKCYSAALYGNTVMNLVANNLYEDEDDECLSCPYFNPEASDCCTYSPEACYYDPDPDTYPF